MHNLESCINKIRRDYGHDTVEHMRVYRHGKLIAELKGSKRSTSFGNEVRDADVVHTHPPDSSPAFSPADLIMSIYGNAKSFTAVHLTRGAWTIVRPAGGWPQSIDHTKIESKYKEALKSEKKSANTAQLVQAIRDKRVSMDNGNALFNEWYAETAIKKLGLKIHKWPR
jgi:hypothetical protein